MVNPVTLSLVSSTPCQKANKMTELNRNPKTNTCTLDHKDRPLCACNPILMVQTQPVRWQTASLHLCFPRIILPGRQTGEKGQRWVCWCCCCCWHIVNLPLGVTVSPSLPTPHVVLSSAASLVGDATPWPVSHGGWSIPHTWRMFWRGTCQQTIMLTPGVTRFLAKFNISLRRWSSEWAWVDSAVLWIPR